MYFVITHVYEHARMCTHTHIQPITKFADIYVLGNCLINDLSCYQGEILFVTSHCSAN